MLILQISLHSNLKEFQFLLNSYFNLSKTKLAALLKLGGAVLDCVTIFYNCPVKSKRKSDIIKHILSTTKEEKTHEITKRKL